MKIENIAKSKRALPLIAIILIASLMGAGIATVMISRQVGMTMSVVALWDLKILDTNGSTELTAIALGIFHRNDVKVFATGPDAYGVKNLSELPCYLSYTASGLGDGVTMTLQHKATVGGAWETLTPNTIRSTAVAPNTVIFWQITLTISGTAAFADSTPEIVWNSHSTATG